MRSKLMKIVTIGIFAVALLLNISVYFDANDSSNADLSLGNLKVSLFQKAYAEVGLEYVTADNVDDYNPDLLPPWWAVLRKILTGPSTLNEGAEMPNGYWTSQIDCASNGNSCYAFREVVWVTP